jgi:hypothetical protein
MILHGKKIKQKSHIQYLKFYNEDAEEMLTMLMKARDHFLEGGKIRMKFTIVPVVFKSLLLVQKVFKNKQNDPEWEKKSEDDI